MFSAFATFVGREIDLLREEFGILHLTLLPKFSGFLTFLVGEVDGDLLREEFDMLKLREEFSGFLISPWGMLTFFSGEFDIQSKPILNQRPSA